MCALLGCTESVRGGGGGGGSLFMTAIFLNENVKISIRISLKFVPKGPTDNIQHICNT